MHYLDANKTAGEKARRQLQKNAASNIGQVLAATPHKAPTIRPPNSHHENYPKSGQPARTYIQQLYKDTGCSPEDQPEAMNDSEKWRERVRDICAGGTTQWWWWWWLTEKSTGTQKIFQKRITQQDIVEEGLLWPGWVGVFSSSEKLKLQFISGRQNAADYLKMLNDLSLAQEGVVFMEKNEFFSKIMLLSTMHQ